MYQHPPEGQQPYTGYPQQPQQPYYQPQQFTPPPQPYYPPQQQAPRKPKRWPWIVALFVFFFLGIGVGNAGHSTSTTTSDTSSSASTAQQQPAGASQAQPTQAPAPAQKPQSWQVTHTFTGNGAKKTETFAIGDNWKLQWKCNPASFMGSYNVIVSVTNSDNTPADFAAVNTMCKAGNTSGETQEHQGGNVFLDVNSEGDWTITIQELK
jgi:hypothetical protein